MSEISSFKDVIELWDTREAMGAETGAGALRVSKWWQRNRIPPGWWAVVLRTERAVAKGLTAALLTEFAARAEVREEETSDGACA